MAAGGMDKQFMPYRIREQLVFCAAHNWKYNLCAVHLNNLCFVLSKNSYRLFVIPVILFQHQLFSLLENELILVIYIYIFAIYTL